MEAFVIAHTLLLHLCVFPLNPLNDIYSWYAEDTEEE